MYGQYQLFIADVLLGTSGMADHIASLHTLKQAWHCRLMLPHYT